ncbi:MAG: acetoin utilization protein AcuC [Gammaproteobacteria bacterium]
MSKKVCVIAGDDVARYGFPDGHPFGPDRHDVFLAELKAQQLDREVAFLPPRDATREELESFHTPDYLDFVVRMSVTGEGYLDAGDTPAFAGIYEAAASVVGGTLTALEAIMDGSCQRAFVPIGGLHHATRDGAAGFCVFNDCGIAVELLRERFDTNQVAYVDIDAHHGDGVYYSFENDSDLTYVDIHEDGRYLYPGTGSAEETGVGAAAGTKLNIPIPPGAGDDLFESVWQHAEEFLDAREPQFILFQCGADSLAGDPLTHLALSEEAHAYAARRLCHLADKHCNGRILAMGGGGYNRRNLARAWTRVVGELARA